MAPSAMAVGDAARRKVAQGERKKAAAEGEATRGRCGHYHAPLCTSFVMHHTNKQTRGGGGGMTLPPPGMARQGAPRGQGTGRVQ
jgi:hypothetical protein